MNIIIPSFPVTVNISDEEDSFYVNYHQSTFVVIPFALIDYLITELKSKKRKEAKEDEEEAEIERKLRQLKESQEEQKSKLTRKMRNKTKNERADKLQTQVDDLKEEFIRVRNQLKRSGVII
jgi:hypothetical protein